MATKNIRNKHGASVTLPYQLTATSPFATEWQQFYTFESGLSEVDESIWASVQNHNSARFSAYYDQILVEAYE